VVSQSFWPEPSHAPCLLCVYMCWCICVKCPGTQVFRFNFRTSFAILSLPHPPIFALTTPTILAQKTNTGQCLQINFCLLKMQFICAMQRIAAKATNNMQQNGSNSNSKHPQWVGKNEV